MSTSTSARPIRAVETANFEPKRVRKAKRKARAKTLMRGYVGNVIADAQMEAADRAEWYRNLRLMKMRRRLLADKMAQLAADVETLKRTVDRVESRGSVPSSVRDTLDQAKAATSKAHQVVSMTAEELKIFARVRVLYVKAV
jgi:hypothetical protein